jgi:hypothetical protein
MQALRNAVIVTALQILLFDNLIDIFVPANSMGQFLKSTLITILLLAGVGFALSNRDKILSTAQQGIDAALATPDPSKKPTASPSDAPKPADATAVPAADAQPTGDTAQPADAPAATPETSAPAASGPPASVDPLPVARANPAVLALEQIDKNAHQALMEDLAGGFQSGKSQDELDQIQEDYLKDALKRFGPYASGATLLALSREELAFIKLLQQGDPEICWSYVSRNKADAARVRAQLRADSELERRISEATAAVLTSSSTTPSGYIDGEKAPQTLRNLFTQLQTKHGADVALLSNPSTAGDAAKRCEMSVDLSESILALPEGDAQDVLRLSATMAAKAPEPAAQTEQPQQDQNVAVTDLEIQAIDQELVKQPYFQALAAAEPDRYRDMVIQIVQTQKAGGGVPEVTSITANVTREMMMKYRPRASDEALVSYFRSLATVAEKVRDQDPASCYALLSGQPIPQGARIALSPADSSRLLSASAQLIRTGTGQEPRAVDANIGQAALNDATKALSPESAAAVAQITSGAQIDPTVACGASLEFYKAVTKLPRTKASSALRVLLANGS